MKKSNTIGKAQTVLGSIEGSELGITLPHEHLFINMMHRMTEPKDPREKELAHQKIVLENVWFARYHKFNSEDNLVLDDQDVAICEASYFKEAGGNTIADLTPNNIGRNPRALVNVSNSTGLNIIMGTGYYTSQSYTRDIKIENKTERNVADVFVADITSGVGKEGIKAGIIGEIGMSWPIDKREEKVLRAAAIAQQETGAAINVHPGLSMDAPFACIDILAEAGSDLGRVVISHVERTLPVSARDARARLAEKGCYLEFDLFGTDGVRFSREMFPYDVPNDATRIDEVIELIEDGFLRQVLISQDICLKVLLQSYGGGGYSHIMRFGIPLLRKKGVSEDHLNTILVENPKHIFTFI